MSTIYPHFYAAANTLGLHIGKLIDENVGLSVTTPCWTVRARGTVYCHKVAVARRQRKIVAT